jgi:aspartate carbamoyltransferase catalytic subunit
MEIIEALEQSGALQKKARAFLATKDLLGIDQLTVEEIEHILQTARSFEEISARAIKKVPTLRGRTIANLFFEPSTRTRTSFELAGKRLSADVINISSKTSAIAKGESLKDMALTLQAMGVDAVVIRHSAAGAPHMFARWTDARVINAGDGAHEHPTQALLDLYTIRSKLGKIRDLRVSIVGDIAHSRVARSNILALTKMGARVTLVAPSTLIPLGIERLGVTVCSDLDEVIPKVDIVYVLRLQLERQKESFLPTLREYSNLFGLTAERMKKAKDGVLVMHPGPLNRGIEISSEVADKAEAVITEQVSSGIAVRMAILFLLFGGVSESA